MHCSRRLMSQSDRLHDNAKILCPYRGADSPWSRFDMLGLTLALSMRCESHASELVHTESELLILPQITYTTAVLKNNVSKVHRPTMRRSGHQR